MEYKQTRQAFADALVELGGMNESIVVLDSDVGRSTKASNFGDAFPERFFNCGIQEANAMDVAVGLALEGFIPFATGFGVFTTCRVMDQIRNSVAYPNINVKIGATHCGISVGPDGASHQSIEDIALMRSLPNMTVIVPGDYYEAKAATLAAAKHQGPVFLRFGRADYPVIEQIHDQGDFEIGKAKVARPGNDITIVSTGTMIGEALGAADILEKQNVSAMVIHMPTVKPLDQDVLLEAAKKTKGIVTVEEHSIIGGLGEAVCSFLSETQPTTVIRVGLKDVFGQSGTADALMDHYGLRAENIAQQALTLLNAPSQKP